jgi:hypothetical protein
MSRVPVSSIEYSDGVSAHIGKGLEESNEATFVVELYRVSKGRAGHGTRLSGWEQSLLLLTFSSGLEAMLAENNLLPLSFLLALARPVYVRGQ